MTRRQRLKRRTKNIIHILIVACITISFLVEGAKMADVLFLALSIVTEGA